MSKNLREWTQPISAEEPSLIYEIHIARNVSVQIQFSAADMR